MGCCLSRDTKSTTEKPSESKQNGFLKATASNSFFEEDSTTFLDQGTRRLILLQNSFRQQLTPPKSKQEKQSLPKQFEQEEEEKFEQGMLEFSIDQHGEERRENEYATVKRDDIDYENDCLCSVGEPNELNSKTSSQRTIYYTPPCDPSQIDGSVFLEQSFMLDDMSLTQKPYYEYDAQARSTSIKPNFEQKSGDLIQRGSVPIYLPSSKAFIIPANDPTKAFDVQLFIKETKEALEALEKERVESQHDVEEATEAMACKEDYINILDSQFDKSISMGNSELSTAQGACEGEVVRWDHIDIANELTQEQQQMFGMFRTFFFSQEVKFERKEEISTYYLFRFLKAKNFNLAAAKTYLTAHLEWRIKEDITHIFDFQFNELNAVQQCYPHGLHFTDKKGQPLYVQRIGALKYEELFKKTTRERFSKYLFQTYERILNNVFQVCTNKAGSRIRYMTVIVDCKDINTKMDQLVSFLKLTTSISKFNYPDILYEMYIINTGFMFKMVWKAVKLMINEVTQAKIKVFEKNFLVQLAEKIDMKCIPKYLGGECPCHIENCFSLNPGP